MTFDLRWKAACGYAIDAKGFDPSTLTYWRRRLAASDRPQRIFEVVREVIAETGAVAGKTRRALDSTILDDAVARQDTVTQLIAQIRRVGREVPGAKDLIAEHCTRLPALTGQDYTATGKPPIAWDDPAARDELVSALVGDALALLAALDVDAIPQAGGKPAEAVALLALVAGQDVEPAEDSDGTDGRWRIARATAPDRVISTVDPDTRHAHKTRERRQDGYKAHLVVEPDTGLTTVVKLTKANGAENSDASVGADLVTADPTIAEGEHVEVLGDSAYATGDMLHTLDRQALDPADQAVADPAGRRGRVHHRRLHLRPPSTEHGDLPRRGHPSPSPQGHRHLRRRLPRLPATRRSAPPQHPAASVVLGEHDQLQREHRQRAADDGFQAVYRQHRPMVERSIAWLTRGSPPRALPRDREEQQLAPPPRRRAQPAPTARPGTHRQERDLGPRLSACPRTPCAVRPRRAAWLQAGGTTLVVAPTVLTEMPLDGPS